MALIVRTLFNVYVSLNMLTCAVVFAPWARPRETVSGLLGRWTQQETGWKARAGRVLGAVVNGIYFWEPNHCVEVAIVEEKAREILYP